MWRFPTPARMWSVCRWWMLTALAASPYMALRLPVAAWRHVRAILVGLGMVLAAWARWRIREDWLKDVQAADGLKRAKHREYFEKRRRARSLWSAFLLIVVCVAILAAVRLWPHYLALVVLLTMIGLDALGHRGAPDPDLPQPPSSPLREGAPARVIVSQVHDILTGRGHRATVVAPVVGPHGVAMEVHDPERAIDEGDLDALERGLQTYPGAVLQSPSRTNAAVTALRVHWSDPLAEHRPPPARAPLSRTVADPADLGYGVRGEVLRLGLLRTSVLVVGGPGSGKSTTLSGMLDYLTACGDVVVDAIDLSGGATFGPWRACLRSVSTDRDEAEEVLRDAVALAKRRTRQLEHHDSWSPGDGPCRVLFIDEFPLLAMDETLLALYGEHLQIGRKAGSTSVVGVTDLTKETMGATRMRKYPSSYILHACSREDVVIALGGGMVAAGWAPHRLVPEQGDEVMDAGKAYVWSGRYRAPEPWRFWKVSKDEARRRAGERARAGTPQLDEDDVIDAVVVPADLEIFRTAFADAGWPEFMATDDIIEHRRSTNGDTPTRENLSEIAARYGFAPAASRRRPVGGGNPRRGYLAADVRRALSELEAE